MHSSMDCSQLIFRHKYINVLKCVMAFCNNSLKYNSLFGREMVTTHNWYIQVLHYSANSAVCMDVRLFGRRGYQLCVYVCRVWILAFKKLVSIIYCNMCSPATSSKL